MNTPDAAVFCCTAWCGEKKRMVLLVGATRVNCGAAIVTESLMRQSETGHLP